MVMIFHIIVFLCVVCGGLSAAADDGSDPLDNKVRVVYINDAGKLYSSSFNVDGLSVSTRYASGTREFPLIMPLSHFIKDRFLSGIVLRKDAPEPSFCASLSLKTVDCMRCRYVEFSTNQYMKELFLLIFPTLMECYDERVTNHDGWNPLLKKEFTRSLNLPGKSMKWSITHRGAVGQRLQARSRGPVCFLIDPDSGVLKGTPIENDAERERIQRDQVGSVFHYKVARARGDLIRTYPWSQSEEQRCVLQVAPRLRVEKHLPSQLKFANSLVDSDDQVRVIFCPGDHSSQYSAVYNISGITCEVFYALNEKKYTLIQPLSRLLQDQFLLGYKCGHGLALPKIESSQFCLKNIPSPACTPTPSEFYSAHLRYCCETVFPKISAKQDHMAQKSRWRLLSGEILRCAFPREKVVKWSTASIEDVQGSSQRHRTEVYIIVRDAGILKGVVDEDLDEDFDDDKWLERSIPPESLLEFKLLHAEKDLKKTYPWTEEKSRFCL